jgi:hypothetical protein
MQSGYLGFADGCRFSQGIEVFIPYRSIGPVQHSHSSQTTYV